MPLFSIAVQVPQEHEEVFIKLLREFEQRDPEHIHLAMRIEKSNRSVNEAIELLKRIDPTLYVTAVENHVRGRS